jgi:FkbM family methyltransferase
MLKQIQKNVYMLLARHKFFYPLLFKILAKKNYLEVEFDKRIKDYQQKYKNIFFIQIGANDGMKFDPTYLYVRKYGWKGILVEPVNYVFKKLKKNYEGVRGLIFEDVAIGDKEGFKNFYMLKKSENEKLPLWYDEIGSFSKEHVLKHKNRIKDIDKRITTEKIKVLTLGSLFEKYHVNKIDFLQIDTEGYDQQILKQIPFNKLKPSMIVYEDRHLSKEEKESCQNLLRNNGYTIIRGLDCFAYLKEKF